MLACYFDTVNSTFINDEAASEPEVLKWPEKLVFNDIFNTRYFVRTLLTLYYSIGLYSLVNTLGLTNSGRELRNLRKQLT